MFRTKLIGILLVIGVSFGTAEEDKSVRLKAYSGVGSVLLDWLGQEEFPAKSIKIYRSIDHQQSYQLLAEVRKGKNRFLDTDLMEGQTAFYYVELIPGSGESYISDLIIPPFGQAFPIYDERSPRFIHSALFSGNDGINRLAASILLDFFAAEIPSTDLQVLKHSFIDLIKAEQWIGYVKTKTIPKLLDLRRNKKLDDFLTFWETKWDEYERVSRNGLLLTPEEYNDKGKELYRVQVNETFPNFFSILERDMDLLKSSLPVVILTQWNNNSKQEIDLYSIQEIVGSTLTFQYGSETINTDLINVPSDSLMSFSLPAAWDNIFISLDDQTIARFPLLNNDGAIIHLMDGSIIKTNTTDRIPFPISTPFENDYWLNEIYHNPADRTIQVEISGKSNELAGYGLFFNEELLWELETNLSFEKEYLDSVFTLNMDEGFGGWLELRKKDNDGNWLDEGETRPILFDETLMESRIPDGGRWQDVNFTTFGEPNDFREIPADQPGIPEVFALFQNYPNPFNVNTSISIDLLQPAIIDLFITDAGGRKVKTFIEAESINPGNYSFVWEAHDHSSGVYFLTIVALVEDYLPVVQSRKMIFLK